MEMSKGLFVTIIMLALFAGTGAIHLAQMVGLIKVDVVMTPTSPWTEEYTLPKGKK